MLGILPQSHSGRAVQIVLERFSILQFWCGGFALAHLFAEWLYTGRPLKAWAVYLVLGVFALALVGGLWLEPKVKKLHLDLYGTRSTPQQREQARRPLLVWRDVSEITHCLIALGLLVYVLQVALSGSPPRFLPSNKFKS